LSIFICPQETLTEKEASCCYKRKRDNIWYRFLAD